MTLESDSEVATLPHVLRLRNGTTVSFTRARVWFKRGEVIPFQKRGGERGEKREE
jgi:hypothetical protein